MTAKKNKKSFSTPDSALAKLGALPKVGAGLGGFDISLGFSHRHALKIAQETLVDTTKEETSKIIADIYSVFSQWREENGVYPPDMGGLLSLGNVQKQEPARDYCERLILAAELSGEEPELPSPWECCPFVSTPVGLFWKLLADDYEPLNQYLQNKKSSYENVIAVLILLSNKPDSEYQSSDCIEAALKLSTLRLGAQKELIREMKPDHEAAFNRRKQKRLKTLAQKDETERKVLAAHKECCKEFGRDNFPIKEIAARTGLSASTVSRYMQKSGLGRYKTN